MNYVKITKAKARKLYDAGEEIFLHTNKLSWNNPWQSPMPVKRDPEAYTIYNIGSFESAVNAYSFYNCDNERGNVVIYLTKID